MICTFFGHRDSPGRIEPVLRTTIIDLIEKQRLKEFLVGNNGNFDSMVRKVLAELSKDYDIKYSVVLAYLPSSHKEITDKNSIYPEGLETVPRRFAIYQRNKWMLERADVVVCYIAYPSSGAGQFVEMAEKQGKRVIYLK